MAVSASLKSAAALARSGNAIAHVPSAARALTAWLLGSLRRSEVQPPRVMHKVRK